MLPPPPPSDFILVVHVDSMAAALAKLNIKVPVEDLVKAIREEDEAKGIKLFTGVALSESTLQPTEPKSDPNPTKPDPLLKERRRRLLELTKEAFPSGKVPAPYHLER